MSERISVLADEEGTNKLEYGGDTNDSSGISPPDKLSVVRPLKPGGKSTESSADAVKTITSQSASDTQEDSVFKPKPKRKARFKASEQDFFRGRVKNREEDYGGKEKIIKQETADNVESVIDDVPATDETNKQEDSGDTSKDPFRISPPDEYSVRSIQPIGKSTESSTEAVKTITSQSASDTQEDSVFKPKPKRKARFKASEQDFFRGRVKNREEDYGGKEKIIKQETADNVESVIDDVPATDETNKQEDSGDTSKDPFRISPPDEYSVRSIQPIGKSTESSTEAVKTITSQSASDVQEDSIKPKPKRIARFKASEQDFFRGRVKNREEDYGGKKKNIKQEAADSVESVIDDVPEIKRKKQKKGTRKAHVIKFVDDLEMGELAPQGKEAGLEAETEFGGGSRSNASAVVSNKEGTEQEASAPNESRPALDDKKEPSIFIDGAVVGETPTEMSAEEVVETTKISIEDAVQSESLSDPVETGRVIQQVLVRGKTRGKVATVGSRKDFEQPLRNPYPRAQPEQARGDSADVFVQPFREEVAAVEEPRMRNPDPDRAHEGATEEASEMFARPRKHVEEPNPNIVHEEKSEGDKEEKHEDRTLSPDSEPKMRNPDPLYPSEEMQDDAEEFSRQPDKESEEETASDQNENLVPENEVLGGKNQNDIGSGDDEELPWAMYRDMKKADKEVEEDDGFSADDESDTEERPSGNHLPELYEYLGSLDNGDTELESKHIPPALFENEHQHHMHKGVDEMKLALAEEEIGEYLEEFEKQVEEEVLMIGSIGLEDVQDEERRIREEHIDFQRAEAKVQKDKKQELAAAMDRAKKHVMTVFREKYGRVRDKEMALMRRDRRIQGQITKAFRRSENQLLKALRKRKNEVEAMYGDLVFADRQFGGGKGKRWKVNWDKTHQPIQIKLKCLRSVRDKMPLGEYVLMVSLYSRLGGHVMKWSNLRGQKWGAATSPLIHDGEYYNAELKVDQSVFTVCPSKPDMRPGMVLMFELFILRGSFTPTDKVVAWGCFPICDGGFNVVEGKYKTPLLRGVIDPSIDKFQTIEESIASDLEYWLCNMYFEIIKLPRYLMRQKEYEVEMQFSSGLVSYPIRTKTGEEFIDGEQPIYGSTSDMQSIAASRVSMPNSIANSFLSVRDEPQEAKPPGHITLTVERPQRKTSRPSSAVSLSMKLQKASEISSELRQRRTSRTSRTSISIQPAEDSVSRQLHVYGSRRSVDERSIAFSDETDTGSGTDYNDDDVYNVKKDNGFKRVKDQPGMYYKVHQNNPIDVYCRKVYNTMPKTAQPSSRRKKKKRLTRQDELRQHTYNVKSLWSNKGHVPRKGREKVQYIGRMMLAELGLSQWRKGQFWLTLLMLVITWFMRMYLHYFGQWILLKALSIPINKFNFYAHTVNLNYQDTLLQARHEIGVVMMGPVTNFFFFTIFVPLTLMFQRFFKWFPDIITHFILAFGIQTFLDPAWIVIVDSALGRYKNTGGVEPIGDAFKLYWHFFRNYRNDDVTFYVSISMTVFLYCVIAFSTAALWYMFFVRLHNNGRLMDVYWRLHGSEEEFFLPYDLEVSNEELNYICRKSEQWRGEEGERRKVAVYDYVWEQEELADECWDDPTAHGKKTGAKETTTHVSIHSIHPDGLIELHRQFLRLPDGAIIEVFGEMNMPGIDEGVKQALMKRTGFKGVSNTVRRSRSLSVSSMGSSAGYGGSRKAPLRRMSSNRLDIPV